MRVYNFPGELVCLSLHIWLRQLIGLLHSNRVRTSKKEKGRTKNKDHISRPARHGSSAFVQKLSCCVPKLTLTALHEAKLLQKIVMHPITAGDVDNTALLERTGASKEHPDQVKHRARVE